MYDQRGQAVAEGCIEESLRFCSPWNTDHQALATRVRVIALLFGRDQRGSTVW